MDFVAPVSMAVGLVEYSLLCSSRKAGRARSALNTDWKLWRATYTYQPLSIALHLLVVSQPGHYVLQNAGRIRVCRFNNPVMHPLPFSSYSDDTGTPQICQVPADLRLICLESFDEEADTHFVCSQEIEKPQTRSISQRSKK
jgi:hypothetical protein